MGGREKGGKRPAAQRLCGKRCDFPSGAIRTGINRAAPTWSQEDQDSFALQLADRRAGHASAGTVQTDETQTTRAADRLGWQPIFGPCSKRISLGVLICQPSIVCLSVSLVEGIDIVKRFVASHHRQKGRDPCYRESRVSWD